MSSMCQANAEADPCPRQNSYNLIPIQSMFPAISCLSTPPAPKSSLFLQPQLLSRCVFTTGSQSWTLFVTCTDTLCTMHKATTCCRHVISSIATRVRRTALYPHMAFCFLSTCDLYYNYNYRQLHRPHFPSAICRLLAAITTNGATIVTIVCAPSITGPKVDSCKMINSPKSPPFTSWHLVHGPLLGHSRPNARPAPGPLDSFPPHIQKPATNMYSRQIPDRISKMMADM